MSENHDNLSGRSVPRIRRFRSDWLVIGAYLIFTAGLTVIWLRELAAAIHWMAHLW